MKKLVNRCVSLLLVVICLTSAATAAEASAARASDYLSSYGAFMSADGGGTVSIWFDVCGTNLMDRVGVTTVRLEESKDGGATFTGVKTFSYLNYSNMLTRNSATWISSVSYQGVAGRYYQAYVTVYASKDGGSDSRSVFASKIKAT